MIVSANGMQSEYWETRESAFISKQHWASGVEKDADIELYDGLTIENLRKISTRLEKNNFIAHGVLQGFLNAILPSAPVIKVVYPDPVTEDQINEYLKIVFKGVDINEEVSMRRWLEQLVSGSSERGDILINLTIDNSRRNPSKIVPELIEASRILTPAELIQDPNVINGVQKDPKTGKVVGYWVRNVQTKDDLFVFDRENFFFVPVYRKFLGINMRVAHLFKCVSNLRPLQTRMIPLLTPIMGILRYAGQLFEAVLISVRVAACFVGVMTSDNPSGTADNLLDGEDPDENSLFSFASLRPGKMMISKMGKGNIQFSAPNRPSDNMDDFFKRISMFISMSMRIPYIQLFMDLSEANYSNYRGAKLETNTMTSRWHEDLTWDASWYIWEVLRELKINRKIRFSLAKVKLKIDFPKIAALDREKDERANKQSLANKTESQIAITQRQGVDYQMLQKELTIEMENETNRVIDKIKLIGKFENETGLTYIEEFGVPKEDRDTSGSREEGEKEGTDLDKDDALTRRRNTE